MALPRALWRGPWPLRALLRPALPPVPRAGLWPPARSCSGGKVRVKVRVRVAKGQIGMEVVGIWQPRQWLRMRLQSFFIRTFLDHDFSLKNFTRGSKQAFALVSNRLSQCKLELLEELVSKEVFQVWKEKLALLSDDSKNALTVDMDKIMLAAAEDIHIYFDDNGRRFARILMGFWYRTSAVISEGAPVGAKIFSFGPEKAKPVVTAKYEFQREFTQGIKPDWTITWIEYPQLL